MSAYRFCRTDDIGLLVEALNHCWSPYFPGRASDDGGGIQAVDSRPSGLVQQLHGGVLRLRPDWRPDRREAAFTGRSSTRSPSIPIIGDRGMADTCSARSARSSRFSDLRESSRKSPRRSRPPRELFHASAYVEETLLTDYVWQGEAGGCDAPMADGTFVIPVTVDDLDANGLLDEGQPQTCWERSVETLRVRKGDIAGLAAASDERIEACILYIRCGRTRRKC